MEHTNKIAIQLLTKEFYDYPENTWHYDREYKLITDALELVESKPDLKKGEIPTYEEFQENCYKNHYKSQQIYDYFRPYLSLSPSDQTKEIDRLKEVNKQLNFEQENKYLVHEKEKSELQSRIKELKSKSEWVSDEEIEKEFPEYDKNGFHDVDYMSRQNAAKWMRDKIFKNNSADNANKT